ncbi:hypothetical protein DCS_02825 [Drechmeria coniospora]|uniref:DNA topoisomerase (ATP-hydrolyzing) n=1 Tax=Drechmeria coniospora TaxID=98403 RepID=A0A151GXC1_DRECN|nr:hypothetical protein DCS_02825 [Drechmeria coniospora]KYK61682.1 hypothetical protein DCS_02825 [Drechmeria coniospora]
MSRSQDPTTFDEVSTGALRSSSATGALIARMESIMESIIDDLSDRKEVSIAMVSPRNLQQGNRSEIQHSHTPYSGLTSLLARLLLILQLSHDALVSGTILTKRHIFYQHQELFEKQRVVDNLVDGLALTLGVNRHQLNIVATAKGLVFGPICIHLHDGTEVDASLGDTGTPIPLVRSISTVECPSTRWILVMEKDATFRALLSTQFWQTSICGPGLLVTAKGYPDLITQSFLRFLHEQHPQIPMFVLADFDPDGLNIFRCYRFGSGALLPGEPATYNPGIRWLGVKAHHMHAGMDIIGPTRFTHHSMSTNPSSRTSVSSTSCRDPVGYLSHRDRTFAKGTLNRIDELVSVDDELATLKSELQVMLMMGVKAEIQWLDDAGNLFEWLNEHLGAVLSANVEGIAGY